MVLMGFSQVPQGLTRAERQQARAELADWYADHGYDEDHMMRRHRSSGCSSPGPLDHGCMAELPGGPGCLCECHDASAAA